MKLIDRLKEKLCLIYGTRRFRSPNTSFTIPHGGPHAEHLLIVLPIGFEDFDAARLILPALIERMDPRAATILVRDNFRSWLPTDLRVRLMAFDALQHSWLGLPPEKLRRKVRELEADVIVDLTPGFCGFTAALVAASSAPLRISLDYEHAARFFNLLVTPEPEKTLRERYETLLNYV